MSSTYGEHLKLSIFGQSHAPAIGMTLDGVPAGQAIDLDELQRFLDRRAPGRAEYATPRKEADRPEFLSGLVGNVTCGAPLAAIIRNTNTRSGDYSNLAVVPRPGHADYTAAVKYGGAQDAAGGGHFSGRLTAPLCIAGGICLQLLRREGIEIISRIAAIAGVEDAGALTASTAVKKFPVVDDAQGTKMREAIAAAKAEGDSVGGIIEVAAFGLPVGLGDPMFGGMEKMCIRDRHDGARVHRAVWPRAEDRGHPCRTRVRPVFRQAAGAGLRVLRPGSARDPHAARENVHPLGAAHVEAAARCAGGTCVMFRNIQAWNFAVHCKNHAEPPENRGGSLFFHHFAPERL